VHPLNSLMRLCSDISPNRENILTKFVYTMLDDGSLDNVHLNISDFLNLLHTWKVLLD